MRSKLSIKVLLFGIIIVSAILRFYGFNWDEGHFLHPDERLYVNASNIHLPNTINEFLSPTSPLNPHMFYYGSFPLYLYKIVNIFLFPEMSFLLVSRFVSALLSTATIFLIFLIGKKLYNKAVGILAAVIFAFAPGGIQHAHFNTTETILAFFVSFIFLLCIDIVKKHRLSNFLYLGILVGLSYATKITALSFLILPFITVFQFWKTRLNKKIIFYILGFVIIAFIMAIFFAPYQIIDYANFTREQNYMQGVIQGKFKPPFTIIYEGTIPYIYQIFRVYPFTFGLVAFPLACFGLIFIFRHIIKTKKITALELLLLAFPLIYFLYTGLWYAKFSRYSILIFPFLSLWSAFMLDKTKKILKIILLICIILNGLLFMRIYIKENTRIAASKWIYENIKPGTFIAGEHWDDNLPLPLGPSQQTLEYKMLQLPVYNPDTSQKIEEIASVLSKSDYLILSSRRVYYSILQNKKQYPITSEMYKYLFKGDLGYFREKTFTNYPFFINDNFADESFQSYDHPPVIIFKNYLHFSSETIKRIIQNKNNENYN